MLVKKKGTALISSIIVLSVMSLLAAMYYRMIRYNMEIEKLNYNHEDKYNLCEEEEKVLYEFMEELNDILKKRENGFNDESLINEEPKLTPIGNSTMKYDSERKKFAIKYLLPNHSIDYRYVNYKFDQDKIILIPDYFFSGDTKIFEE